MSDDDAELLSRMLEGMTDQQIADADGESLETVNAATAALVDRLFACAVPSYTPDGRRTLVLLELGQLQEFFRKP